MTKDCNSTAKETFYKHAHPGCSLMGPQSQAYEVIENGAAVNTDEAPLSEKCTELWRRKRDSQSENDGGWNRDFEEERNENKSKTAHWSREKYIKLYKGRRELYWKSNKK